MSRLAKQLHEKAEQRVAAQQAVDVKLTRGQKASTGASDSEDEEHEEDFRRMTTIAPDDVRRRRRRRG